MPKGRGICAYHLMKDTLTLNGISVRILKQTGITIYSSPFAVNTIFNGLLQRKRKKL